MIEAAVLGAATALLWAIAVLTTKPAVRIAGPWTVMLWMGGFATVMSFAVAVVTGPPHGPAVGWTLAVVAGLATAGAQVCWLGALRRGRVTLVTPIVACDGAVAAVLAVVAGEPLSIVVAAALGGMVIGLVLVAQQRPDSKVVAIGGSTAAGPVGVAVLLALGAAGLYGFAYYTVGRISAIPAAWIVTVTRTIPFLVAAGMALLAGRWRLPRAALGWIVAAAAADFAGALCYVLGARHSIAVAAVVASQYAGIATLGGVFLLHERLRGRQWAGVGILVVGAAVVAAHSAR